MSSNIPGFTFTPQEWYDQNPDHIRSRIRAKSLLIPKMVDAHGHQYEPPEPESVGEASQMDPVALAQSQRLEDLEAAAATLRRDLDAVQQGPATADTEVIAETVDRTARALGVDPAALLDSVTFSSKLASVDPADPAAIAQVVTDTVEANPRLVPQTMKPNPAQGSSASGATFAGPTQGATPAERLRNLARQQIDQPPPPGN